MKYWSDSTKGFYDQFHKEKPVDCVELTEVEYKTLITETAGDKEIYGVENGKPVIRDRVITVTATGLASFLKYQVDLKAQEHGFDNILEAVSYCEESTDNVRRPKGLALRAWRSACWAVYDLKIVESPLPSEDQLLRDLPVLVL